MFRRIFLHAIMDKSAEGRQEYTGNTTMVRKHPEENREQLQKFPLNLKFLYATGRRCLTSGEKRSRKKALFRKMFLFQTSNYKKSFIKALSTTDWLSVADLYSTQPFVKCQSYLVTHGRWSCSHLIALIEITNLFVYLTD